MVDKNEKWHYLYFRDTLFKPSGRYTCQSSRLRHLPIMHYFPHKAKLILALSVFYKIGFIVMPSF